MGDALHEFFRLDDFGSATCTFATISLPSDPLLTVLVVKFAGIADNDPPHFATFRFMRIMIAAGLEACLEEPVGLVLDLSSLDYAWGDEMAGVLGTGSRWRGGEFPTAVVVSHRNETGLTSLLTQEMFADPCAWLFPSVEDAVRAVEQRLPSLTTGLNGAGGQEVSYSPDGRYRLEVTAFQQSDLQDGRPVTQGVLIAQATGEPLFRIKREDDRFWHCWVQRDTGLYMVCSETLEGQTVIDLQRRQLISYRSPEDHFISTAMYPSPDGRMLAIVGCYQAGPREVRVYDFTAPMILPRPQLMGVLLDSQEEFTRWVNDRALELTGGAGGTRNIVVHW
jgi:hypothetical protein